MENHHLNISLLSHMFCLEETLQAVLPFPYKADPRAPSSLHRLLHLGFSRDRAPESRHLYAGTPLSTGCLHRQQIHVLIPKLTLCLAVRGASGFAHADSASPGHRLTFSGLPFCLMSLLSWRDAALLRGADLQPAPVPHPQGPCSPLRVTAPAPAMLVALPSFVSLAQSCWETNSRDPAKTDGLEPEVPERRQGWL